MSFENLVYLCKWTIINQDFLNFLLSYSSKSANYGIDVIYGKQEMNWH